MPFGLVAIGGPGSGKSTFCKGMQHYMQLSRRKVAVINLDPANDALPYECAVDIMDLVSLEEVMRSLKLGSNGGLIYCMDYLEQNLDWLQERLEPLVNEGIYLIFDCPGQVELFTLHGSLKGVIAALDKKLHCRLTAVQLVDAHLCTDASKYLAALLLSLSTMLHFELPQVNVLSKIDLLESYGTLPFQLEYFTEVQDLSCLADTLAAESEAFGRRHARLTGALAETVEDFGLVSFVPLAIEDRDSVRRVLGLVDKANGFVFVGVAGGAAAPYPPDFVYGMSDAETGTWEADTMREPRAESVQGRGAAVQQVVERRGDG